MNPDYRKLQDNPDGKMGHDERTYMNNELHRESQSKKFIISERAVHKFYEPKSSLVDLQCEFRMAQCKSKTDTCNQNKCLLCPDYHPD